MMPSAESFTRGGSQYTVAVSLPGSAIRSRESGQRILGGSKSARGEEREWGDPPVLGPGYENQAPAPGLSHPQGCCAQPRQPVASTTCCNASTECHHP